jgi:hypothetical protein
MRGKTSPKQYKSKASRPAKSPSILDLAQPMVDEELAALRTYLGIQSVKTLKNRQAKNHVL